jgi:hypothetical protein
MKRLHAYLQLMRIPNIFTAMADVLAGYLLMSLGRQVFSWIDLLALLLSSSSIYAGGCVLNDIHDRGEDSRERPQRPIPSGRVTVTEAVLLVILLFSIALAATGAAGRSSLIVAGTLVLLVVVYDLLTKKYDWLRPLNMAGCRAFNLLLGMSGAFAWTLSLILFPILSLSYVWGLTVLSKFEAGGEAGWKRWMAPLSIVLLIIIFLAMNLLGTLRVDGLVFLGLFLIFTLPQAMPGLLKPAPETIGRAVKYLILGIPILDACYVSGIHGWAYAVPVVLCILPAVLLAKYFYVT